MNSTQEQGAAIDSSGVAAPSPVRRGAFRIALLGNPNTGKTTLFNQLSGLRHKTSNFPGTTLEARVGRIRLANAEADLVDLPGIYSLELDQLESAVCREVLSGKAGLRGQVAAEPDALCIVADATNLPRSLALVGEGLRRRLPTVIAINMVDLARRRGLHIDAERLAAELGCPVVLTSARTGKGLAELAAAMAQPRIARQSPPGSEAGLRMWADDLYASIAAGEEDLDADTFTDRLDRVFTHPVAGIAVFALVMAGLFYSLFILADYPMGWIEQVFATLSSAVEAVLPDGFIQDLLASGVVAGVGATVVFLPQICLLFFLISLLEDTGYLARAAFVMDRLLRPFGLPGHAFMPLLSSHACAIPGIMATRAIPDRRQRLATILVAPFMTCSARLPVYVLVTGILFRDRPGLAALAFVGCYALGIAAGVLSALLARKTILRGESRPMALELPSYKLPSIRTALLSTLDRGALFLKKAGTTILAISMILWWLGAYPIVPPPQAALDLRAQATALASAPPSAAPSLNPDELLAEADRLEARHAKERSFAGRIGKSLQPAFAPLGYDWQLTVGVLSSFAAREVFVATMAVIVTGEESDDDTILEQVAQAERPDGSPVFTPAVAWSLLVFYVLAMQCLPTLVVTAREAGAAKWALLQLGWMSAVAYGAALLVYQLLR